MRWENLVCRNLYMQIADKHGSLGAFNALLDLGGTAKVKLLKELNNNRYEYLHAQDET